ncbi:MAG: hypothetical protein WBV84_05255 [Nitrososphaeraceae archaeon]
MQVLETAPSKKMVDSFLDSIARNSRNAKNTYQTGLTHFSRFLKGV